MELKKRKGIPWAAAWLIFCAVCALSAYYLSLQSLDKTAVQASAVTIGTMFLGIAVTCILQSIANIVRAVLWKKKGYSDTPIVIFFLLIESGKVKFESDLSFMFSIQFPKDILKEESERLSKALNLKVINIERMVYMSILVLEVIVSIIALLVGNNAIIFAMLISFTLSVVISLVNSHLFCGNMVTIMYFKEGNGVYFLTRQLLTFEVNEPSLIRTFISTEMKGDRAPGLEFFAINGWEEVLFYEILYWENNLTKKVYEHLKKHWIHPFTFDKGIFTPERVNLLIIYMHLIMLRKDEAERRYLYTILDGMLSFENDYNERLENELLFYRDMCMYNPNVELMGSALFRDIDFISFYPFYKDAQEMVFSLIAEDYFHHVDKYRSTMPHWKKSKFEDIPVDSYEF